MRVVKACGGTCVRFVKVSHAQAPGDVWFTLDDNGRPMVVEAPAERGRHQGAATLDAVLRAVDEGHNSPTEIALATGKTRATCRAASTPSSSRALSSATALETRPPMPVPV